jgi:hypothetical protein
MSHHFPLSVITLLFHIGVVQYAFVLQAILASHTHQYSAVFGPPVKSRMYVVLQDKNFFLSLI